MVTKLFLTTALLCVLCVDTLPNWDCTTYLNQKGLCVSITNCESVKTQLTACQRDHRTCVTETLNKYNCGFIGNDPKVCCPLMDNGQILTVELSGMDCTTTEGDAGTCTTLEDCGYMRDMIWSDHFVLADNAALIKESECPQPAHGTNVCCKSATEERFSKGSTKAPPLPGHGCVLSAEPPPKDSQCCGTESSSDNRIIGGTIAGVDQYPWLVLIDYKRGEINCGGSLISGKYVLTAAHCMVDHFRRDRKAVSVRLGEYNTTNPGRDCAEVAGGGVDCTDGSISIEIESYVVHESYDPKQALQYNDIALIRLKETANYTYFIRPVCLPSSDLPAQPSEDLKLYVAGWGIFDKTLVASVVKRYALLPFVGKEQCQNRFSTNGNILDSQTCVGGEANKDTCKGDSGGPLMLLNDITMTYEVVGVTSFGFKTCGLDKWPSVYTKVYNYLDWIRNNIKP